MTTEMSRRHQLFEHARETCGPDTAETLMDLLPPDRDELATKSDLVVLRGELREEMGELRVEMANLRADMHERFAEQTRTLRIASVTTMLSAVGLAFAAAHFA